MCNILANSQHFAIINHVTKGTVLNVTRQL